MSDKEVTTRILESDREKLNNLSAKYTLKSSVILGFLIDNGIKYGMLEQGWQEKLAEDQLQETLADLDIEFRKKVELKKVDAQIKAKMMVFKEWLGVLDTTQKKQFLENVLGDTNSGDFLEKLTNYQMFIVDGLKRLYPMDDRGRPMIAFVQPDDLIPCMRGFHIQGNRCDCRYWESCEFGKQSYEDWLAVNGSPLEQQRYLEESERAARLARRGRRY